MGSFFSYLVWGGDPDEVNPVSGLSRRDIYLVQKSWKVAYADPVATGSELLKRLYRAHPETKAFFKMIAKVPEEEFSTNIQFKAHVINLMTSLNLAVINLHEPEVVAVIMEKLGDSHKKRMIQREHFVKLKDVIVNMFIEVLNMDQRSLEAWGRTVTFWYKHIFAALETTS